MSVNHRVLSIRSTRIPTEVIDPVVGADAVTVASNQLRWAWPYKRLKYQCVDLEVTNYVLSGESDLVMGLTVALLDDVGLQHLTA
jgi:hypothetical protein